MELVVAVRVVLGIGKGDEPVKFCWKTWGKMGKYIFYWYDTQIINVCVLVWPKSDLHL